MYFLDNNSGIATMPPLKETQSTTPLWFTEGDGHKGISWPGEDWFNIQQAEQLALLDAAGIRPDKSKLNQLTLAIRAIIGQEALLKTQALAEIAAAGKGAQEKARTHLGLGKLATQDGIQEAMLHRKGIVQLNSSPRSADETTAATPKAVNDRVNAVVDNAPSDLDTLNKLAQAISNNPKFAESVTQLLSQKLAKNENGADIPDKNQFLENLGLTETIVPVGVPLPWPSENPPTGWLKCNGDAFDKVACPQLAAVYPSGRTPDLRGEFIRGWDDGRGVDNGRVLQSKQGDTIRNITGSLFYGYDADINAPTTNASAGATYYDTSEKLRDTENGLTVSVNYNYNSWYPAKLDASRVVPTANENRPRNIAFNYIVRAA